MIDAGRHVAPRDYRRPYDICVPSVSSVGGVGALQLTEIPPGRGKCVVLLMVKVFPRFSSKMAAAARAPATAAGDPTGVGNSGDSACVGAATYGYPRLDIWVGGVWKALAAILSAKVPWLPRQRVRPAEFS